MLNDEGKSFAFDDRGAGYGRGEGCVVVVLKRLNDALRSNDHIRAIIQGSGVNQDGRTSGITNPHEETQARLAESVLRKCGLRQPEEINYVEAHGTGTVVGDTTEVRSISRVYCHSRQVPLHVGSIKSNTGHLESASGLAGLLKAILIVEKGLIPPQAHLKTLRPNINPEDLNITVETPVPCYDTSLIRPDPPRNQKLASICKAYRRDQQLRLWWYERPRHHYTCSWSR